MNQDRQRGQPLPHHNPLKRCSQKVHNPRSFLDDYGAFETDFSTKLAKVRGFLKSHGVSSLPDAPILEQLTFGAAERKQVTKGLYDQDMKIAQFLSAQVEGKRFFKKGNTGLIEEITDQMDKMTAFLATECGTMIGSLSSNIRASRQDIPLRSNQLYTRWKARRAEQYITTLNHVCTQAIQYIERAAAGTVPHVLEGQMRLESYKEDWKRERKQRTQQLAEVDETEREEQTKKKEVKDDWSRYVTNTAQVKQEHLRAKKDWEDMLSACLQYSANSHHNP